MVASRSAYLYAASVFSRSGPRKTASKDDLYAAALRGLTRRAHSVHEMRKYLERRSEEKDMVSSVIARLREQNYLDDARYAVDYARLHANSRRQGRFRIARELRARGVADRHIEAAADAVFAETDESSLVRERIQRKLARTHGSGDAKIEQKKLASLYRSLMAAGFSAETIRAEIRRATRAEPAELDEAFRTDQEAD